jgi:hypothetical protein
MPVIIEGLAPLVSGGRWPPYGPGTHRPTSSRRHGQHSYQTTMDPDSAPAAAAAAAAAAADATGGGGNISSRGGSGSWWGSALFWAEHCRHDPSTGGGTGPLLPAVQAVRYQHGARAWGGHVPHGPPTTIAAFVAQLPPPAGTAATDSAVESESSSEQRERAFSLAAKGSETPLQEEDSSEEAVASGGSYLADVSLLAGCPSSCRKPDDGDDARHIGGGGGGMVYGDAIGQGGSWKEHFHVPSLFAPDLLQSLDAMGVSDAPAGRYSTVPQQQPLI